MTWGKKAAIAATLTLAEFCWRFGRFLCELYFYPKHYPYNRRRLTALQHAFNFSVLSRYFLALILAVVSSQYLSIFTLFDDILEQSFLVPLWCILRYIKFNESTLDYADWIRSDSGLDYATGMAANYFVGYLKLTLPSNENQDGIVRRIEKYEDKHDVKFAVKRLLILIPNSLHSRPVIESRLMRRQDRQPLEGVRRDRAGVSRPYTNDVYSIVIDGNNYYISVEGATPLLSYFDALHFNLTSTWQMEAMKTEIMIKFYKYLKKILKTWPGTQEQCELVFYNDYTSDEQPVDVGEILSIHIKQMWEKMPVTERPDLSAL